MSVQENISNIHEGETWAISGTVTESGGPVDLSGASITMRVETVAGVVSLPADVTDGPAGEYLITSEPVARGIATGVYSFQVWCLLANGDLIVPSRGKISVLPDIPAPV